MPDNSRLAKLIEQRKRQEKQNDRIRLHKNKLDFMRLEKLSNYYDRNKQILKQLHLTAEAKCIKSLEKIYHRQCKIEDEKKEKEAQLRREGEKVIRKTREGLITGDIQEDGTTITTASRRRVASASKQERAKTFMNKAKSLSSGYRDNDPPQSYYKIRGLVPPDRMVTPEISYSAQAQTGGGFGRPASAFHVKNLKRWHGIPHSVPQTPLPDTERDDLPRPRSSRKSPSSSMVSRQFSLTEAIRELENDENLDILPEENESSSGKSTKQSSESNYGDGEEQQVVYVRPSTAPGSRAFVKKSRATLPMSARTNKDVGGHSGNEVGAPPKSMLRKPSAAIPGVPNPEENEGVADKRQSSGICFAESELPERGERNESSDESRNSRMIRQSSSISFAEVPQGRRRSSVAPPMALLHRRQSNVAAIHKSIQRNSKLLRPKSNKMKRKSGARMGLIQSVMTNAENEILVRKLKEKSECLAAERDRRLERVRSAPVGARRIAFDEDCPSVGKVHEEYREIWAEHHDRKLKNKGQKALIKANIAYSGRLGARVQTFLQDKSGTRI